MVDLRENERRTLSSLEKLVGKASAEQVVVESSLPDSAVMRAILMLQEKNLVKVHERKYTIMRLNEEGKLHAARGLPERRLVNALETLGGRATRTEAFKCASLEEQFVPIALGWAQRKKWTTFENRSDILCLVKKADEGIDERLVKLAQEKGLVVVDDLPSELRKAVQILKSRKLLDIEEKTDRIIELTDSGRETLKETSQTIPEVTKLDQELIVSGKWRSVKLQRYNIHAPVAKTWPGKKHPYLKFLEEVRETLVTLGFKEMNGTAVETSFFNFDALYTPQDHPAREEVGIYFVKSPTEGSLEGYEDIVQNVKQTHEDGWETGSMGWRYKYSLKEARRLILRGHGTCLSARTLVSKDLEVPGRYFSIVRCYRPEVLDKTHLTEFNQVEGIVIDETLNLRDLLGVLERFAIEVAGADKVKFKPDYFPFTEPSVELNAFKKGCGWIEFGGSGIFRPEVTLPLGVKQPVIAWGLGIDRLFMMKAGIEDIRQIFSQDLDWIRRKELV